MKKCIHCGVELVLNENWYKSDAKQCRYVCKRWQKKRDEERYAYKPKIKHVRKYKLKTKNSIQYMKQYKKQYRKTERGQQIGSKNSSKWRGLGWNLIHENPFAEDVIVDYHHTNNNDVVAIPRELHNMYKGKQHQEKLKSIIEQIYVNGISKSN